MTTTALEKRAMIVKLKTSAWTNSTKDASVSAEVAEQYNTSTAFAQVQKHLIDKEALKEVRAAIQATKSLHDSLTLPWADNGERLLPIRVHERYVEKIAEAIAEVDNKVSIFARRYTEEIDKARTSLGKMFNETDYPPAEIIADKFGASYEINPVPAASHFVVDIGEEDAERIRNDIERRMQIKMEAAMVKIYERIEEALRHLIDRLGYDADGTPKRLHKSTLDALQGIAAAVPDMNLTGDGRLTEIAERLNTTLGTLTIDDLRYKSTKPTVVAATTQRRHDALKELETVAGMYFGRKPAAAAAE